MELTKTDKKYMVKILKERIVKYENYLKSNQVNYENPQLVNYTEMVYRMNVENNTKEIEQCKKILEKLL